jgi:selenocysteine lyase/cysteine desulfurase
MEAMIRDLRFSNEIPVDHMWNVLEPRIESCRRDLAQMFGCDPEEMAITRNASEAHEIMILGIDLKRGDEVIITNQNYGRDDHDVGPAGEARRHRGEDDLRWVPPPGSDDDIVNRFRRRSRRARASSS